MKALLKCFWDICLLRLPPQELPQSVHLLGVAAAMYVLAGFLVAATLLQPLTAMMAALADLTLLAGLLRAVLWVRALDGRYMQSLTALAGAGAIISFAALPLTIWQQQLQTEPDEFTLPSLLLLFVLAWNLTVAAHVLRHALSTSWPMATGMAAVYGFVAIRVMGGLFFTTG